MQWLVKSMTVSADTFNDELQRTRVHFVARAGRGPLTIESRKQAHRMIDEFTTMLGLDLHPRTLTYWNGVSGESSQQFTVGAHVIDLEKIVRFWAENLCNYCRQRVGAAAPTDEPACGCITRATSYVQAQQLAEERARGDLLC